MFFNCSFLGFRNLFIEEIFKELFGNYIVFYFIFSKYVEFILVFYN